MEQTLLPSNMKPMQKFLKSANPIETQQGALTQQKKKQKKKVRMNGPLCNPLLNWVLTHFGCLELCSGS